MLKRAIMATVICLPLSVHADIFKCTSADGQITYSNTPCTGDRVETYHKETEEERLQREQRQREYEQQRLEREQLAAIRRLSAHAIDLIEAGSIEAARQYAKKNGLDYDRLLVEYQQRLIARHKEQQQELDQQRQRLADQQTALARQQSEIAKQQGELSKQQAELRTGLENAEDQRRWNHFYYDRPFPNKRHRRQRPASPQYLPSIGMWCKQKRGVISCWKK